MCKLDYFLRIHFLTVFFYQMRRTIFKKWLNCEQSPGVWSYEQVFNHKVSGFVLTSSIYVTAFTSRTVVTINLTRV